MKFINAVLMTCLVIAPAAFAHDLSDYDVHYIDTLTKHHRDGIKMAQMAVDKAQHAELRQLAQKMIDDQQKDIAEMQSWRDQWAKNAPMSDEATMQSMPGMMPESHMQKMMSRLQNAQGNDFDLEFTEMMPMHHQGAIDLSQAELSKGNSGETKAMARKTIAAQKKEQAQMRAWHSQWGGTTMSHRRMAKD